MKLFIYLLLLNFIGFSQTPDTLWTKTLGGSADECPGYGFDYRAKIAVNANGESYVVCATVSNDFMVGINKGSADCWIIKLNEFGDTIWSKVFGGTNADLPQDIIALEDGGCIVAGFSYSDDLDFAGNHGTDGESDGFIMRIDNEGNLIWNELYGGSSFMGVEGADFIYDIILLENGNIMALGQTNSQNGDLVSEANFDYFYVGWMLEVEILEGDIIDTKKIAWTGHDEWNTDEIIEGIEISDGSGYYFLGLSTHTFTGADYFWLIKTNANWEVLWQKEIGCTSQNSPYSITETDSLTVVFLGIVYSSDGDVNQPYIGGYGDVWIAEADSTGTIIRQKIIGGTQSETIYKIINNNDGHFLLSGFTRSTDFFASGDTTTVADFWIISMDGNLDTLWTFKKGGTESDILTDIAINNGNIFVAGRTESDDLFINQNFGAKDLWVAKFENPYLQREESLISNSINVFPNPSSGFVTIENTNIVLGKWSIEIYTITGELIRQTTTDYKTVRVNDLEKGIYLIRVNNSLEKIARKLIVY
ncbi:MAG: T9SS type A sorting domain-containing protein [Bacteroidales bacterium]|nr:T9SS type A sorting domain-containing protein [Bacteroidales bacterium]